MGSVLVVKFGGSCLASPDKIIKRAQQIRAYREKGLSVIAVVSAMGSSTNALVKLAYQVSDSPLRRELDMLLTTGERVSMALLSMVLNDLDCPAISFTGSQAGILTENMPSASVKIKELKPIRVAEELKNNKVVIVAGFQGVDPNTKEITTLGRGGSDTTAMAFAHHFKGACYIFKDVAGICNADPNKFKSAQTIKEISHSQLLKLCQLGSQVLHLPAVEFAKETKLNYRIVDAENPDIFTLVTSNEKQQFIGVAIAENVFSIRLDNINITNWLAEHKLQTPNLFTAKNTLFFWGDLEITQPIVKSLICKGLDIQKDLSLISVFSSAKKLTEYPIPPAACLSLIEENTLHMAIPNNHLQNSIDNLNKFIGV